MNSTRQQSQPVQLLPKLNHYSIRQSQPAQLLPKCNFASQFFPNFISETSVDHTISNASVTSNQHFQFSVSEEKFRLFHAENLISIWWAITQRKTVQCWILNKQYIKTLQKRTPNHLTKTLLKVFYTIAVKLQVKYSLAFRKLLRNHHDAKQPDKKVDKTNNMQMASQKMVISLVKLCEKFNAQTLEQFFNVLKKANTKPAMENEEMISGEYLQTYNQIWKANHHKNNLLNKVQILMGTLNLAMHPLMREAFLMMAIFKRQTLEENNISLIKAARKQSCKVNNSIEAELIQDQFFQDPCLLIQDNPSLPLQSASKEENAEQFGEKKENIGISEFVDRQNPKHLKFSKDTKRKMLKSTQAYGVGTFQQDANQADNHIDRSLVKSQVQQLSQIKRNSIMNSSEFHSRSFVKKVYNPLQLNTIKSYRVITLLQENDLPPELNEQNYNKSFQNMSDNAKSRPLKQLELRNQFTDFNDLFFVRQMSNFYEATIQTKKYKSRSSNSPKKSISLAKIKERINNKTMEQYFQKHKQSNEKLFHDLLTQRFLSSIEQRVDYALGNKKGGKRSSRSRDSMQIQSSNAHRISGSYKNLPSDPQNHHILRIPAKMPQYFDYYVEKAIEKSKNRDKQQSKGSSLAHRNLHTERKRKNSIIKSNKKVFNAVKSSTNRLSTQVLNRSKKSLQNASFLSPNYLRHKADAQHLSKSRLPPQKKINKQQGARKSTEYVNKGEYYIGFRDPPKKKIKKNM